MSLSKLPPEVLSSVLNNRAIPVLKRLRMRLLSARWCAIIEDGFKKKHSQVIREAPVAYHKCHPDDLIIPPYSLTDEMLQILLRLLPSLTRLTLALGIGYLPMTSWRMVPSLLAHFSSNLTSVKLYGLIDDTVAESLAAALTALSALNSLTLRGSNLSFRLLPHIGPVLARLETFACPNCVSEIAVVFLHRLSSRCTHLQLHSTNFARFTGPFLLQLSASLTHLHLQYCCKDVWQSLSPMHGLTSLTLGFRSEDLDSTFFRHFAPFTRLTDLKLLSLVYRTPLALPSNKCPPLPTIKRLTLEVYFGKYRVDFHAFFQTIGALFPALVHLTIITWRNIIPVIRRNLGNLSFFVEIVDRNSVDIWSPDW